MGRLIEKVDKSHPLRYHMSCQNLKML